MTILTGVIGDPVDHSRSPQIHNRWYQDQDLDYFYTKFLVPAQQLVKFLNAGRQQDLKTIQQFALVKPPTKIAQISGLSVTLPHKEACRQYLDQESAAVTTIGACNTIVFTNNQLHGYNTDWQGWLTAIQNQTDLDLKQAPTLIIGAGGAAKAIGYALNQIQANNVTITNRTISKGQKLAQQYNWQFQTKPTQKFDLIINATSLGLKQADPNPVPQQLLHSDVIISDLTYSKNQLQQLCYNQQINYYNGKQMLIEQAKHQHQLFTKTTTATPTSK